jgi:hypothetical protein
MKPIFKAEEVPNLATQTRKAIKKTSSFLFTSLSKNLVYFSYIKIAMPPTAEMANDTIKPFLAPTLI